jgi:hypothetical protein
MKINQIITENFNGEYDDEAGMAQTNLHTIARAAQGLLDTIDDKENLPEWVQEKIAKVEGMMVTAWDYLLSQEEQGIDPEMAEEFDLIESIIERLAAHNGVDAEMIWEDLETLTEDELYAFAVTSEPIMENQDMAEGQLELNTPDPVVVVQDQQGKILDKINLSVAAQKYKLGQPENIKKQLAHQNYTKIGNYTIVSPMTGQPQDATTQGVAEDWQKANKRDRTAGMSQKAVNAYRRENPGSKLKTAVTTKPSKLKRGSKASKRRKSYCSRSRGQMKMHSISCAKTPDKAICKARRRWNC